MNIYIILFISTLIGYLLGSLSFAIILSRVFYRQDIRNFGSGNAGMANVLRTYGKRMAAATLFGDASKGTFAVLIAKWLAKQGLLSEEMVLVAGFLAAFGAILGHLFPLFFNFRGGKGIAVGVGCVVSLQPILVAPLLTVFFVMVLLFKMVSLGSISAAASYPLFTALHCYLTKSPLLLSTIFSAAFACIIVFMHRENIARILKGNERKIGQKV